MEVVVLLNADYTPLMVVKLRRAINLLVKKKAVIVEATNRIIQNTEKTFSLAVPRIIRLIDYVKQLGRVHINCTKRNILLRDGFKCAYCGEKVNESELTIDHIIPTSRGGKTTFENCVSACFECNSRKKKDKTPEEAGMTLRIRPYKPSFVQFIAMRMRSLGITDSIEYAEMA